MLSSLTSLATLSPIFELADLGCFGYTWVSYSCTFGLQCEYSHGRQLDTIKASEQGKELVFSVIALFF